MKTRETRVYKGLEVRDAAKDSGIIATLTGYAAVFDSDSLPFDGWEKPWVERIAPGAFKRSLKESPDVAALWSHRADAILGRTPNTLRVSEDDRGLKVEIDLIDTQQNRDVLASVKAGQVDSMSFGFAARSTKWDQGKEQDVRTLLDVDLFEVSAVVWPAYPATSLSARSALLVRSHDVTSEVRAIAKEREEFFANAKRSESDAHAVALDAVRGMAFRFL